MYNKIIMKPKINFHILTLFPKTIECVFSESIIKRAREKGLVKIHIHNFRDWGIDKRKQVDDKACGGGAGMVLRVDVIDKALKAIKLKIKNGKKKVILLTPQGKVFKQKTAEILSKEKNIILICGHYEGFDERIRKNLVDEEISIGDYVLTGGEIPAAMLIDSISRLIPGVLGKEESLQEESFKDGLLEYPQYTKPNEYKGWKVPDILLSGNHAKINQWRRNEAVQKTKKRRPDLL